METFILVFMMTSGGMFDSMASYPSHDHVFSCLLKAEQERPAARARGMTPVCISKQDWDHLKPGNLVTMMEKDRPQDRSD
jgi:hypothetical protein